MAIEIDVRSVTEGEIAHFREHGWAKLPSVISADVAGEILERIKHRMGAEGADADASYTAAFTVDRTASREDELMQQVVRSSELGRNAARLLGRDSSVRFFNGVVGVKLPSGHDRAGDAGQATDFHQDKTSQPFDRTTCTFWFALSEITPDMGSMHFYSGSHKLGWMGNLLAPGEFEQWRPLIEANSTLSEPNHLMPGDATVHHPMLVHGAPPNRSDRARWAWWTVFYPGDARWTGVPHADIQSLGVQPNGPIDAPLFPLVYEPAR